MDLDTKYRKEKQAGKSSVDSLGFSVATVILIILVAALVCLAGWAVYQNNKNTPNTPDTTDTNSDLDTNAIDTDVEAIL